MDPYQPSHQEFSQLFLDTVMQFYKEHVKDARTRYPDFEQAIVRAKNEGVLPYPAFLEGD